MNKRELRNIGLSDRETTIYLTLLSLEKATVHEIARNTSISRSTVYLDIESLIDKKLISEIESQKKKYYVPESPERLIRLNEKQKEHLENTRRNIETVLPDLIDSFAKTSTKPLVRFFEGKEGITAIREEMLLSQQKEISLIVSFVNLNKLYSREELEEYTKRRIKKNIKAKLLFIPDASSTNTDFVSKLSLTEGKPISNLVTEQNNIQSDIFIFDKKVAIMSTAQPYSGVIIENKSIRKTMQEVFDTLWNQM